MNTGIKKRAFTLLEILLVIAAIGILAAIVVVAINPARQLDQVRNAARQSDINSVHKALGQYLIDTGSYPDTIGTSFTDICSTEAESIGGSIDCTDLVDLRVLVPNYLASIPRDVESSGVSTGYRVAINPDNDAVALVASLAEQDSIAINAFDEMVTDGLNVYFDAGNSQSYSGSGSVWTDLSGNDNNGTLVNGVGFTSDDGGALVFDGVNDFVRTGRISNTGNSSTSVTWGVWVSPGSTQGNIVSMSSVTPQSSWNMPPISAVSQRFRGQTWPNALLSSQNSYILNTWYYVVLVFDQSLGEQRLYVNGQLQGRQTGITYSASGTDNFMFLGQQNPGAGNTGMFDGRISQFQVYGGKALSDEEVEQNFDTFRNRYGI